MSIALVVTMPFADYDIGDRITDADLIAEYLEHQSTKVSKINLPEEDDQKDPPHVDPEPTDSKKGSRR